MRNRLVTMLVLAAASGLIGCGKGDSKGTSESSGGGAFATAARPAPPLDGDLARLVPGDALGVVYAPSIDALEAKVKAFVTSIDPSAAKEVDISSVLKDVLGPAFDQLDRSGPILVALSVGSSEKPEPAPTFVFAVRDGAAAIKAFGPLQPGQPSPVVRGRFLALSTVPGFAPADKPSALVDGLPGGDVAIRLDLARVVTTFRKEIDGMLEQMSDPAGGPAMPGGPTRPPAAAASADMMKSMTSGLKDFLNTAERLDLGLRLEGSNLNLDVAFTAKAGGASPVLGAADVDLAALAACLPKDYPIEALLALRFEDLMKWSSSILEASISAMPEASRDSFRTMMAQSTEMYALLDGGMAMGMSMGASGIEGVAVVTAKDPKAYLAKWDAMLKGGELNASAAISGVSFEPLPLTTVSGVEVRTFVMKFDFTKMAAAGGTGPQDPEIAARVEKSMESMFGKEGFRMRMAAIGNRIVTVIGGDDALMSGAIAAAKNPAKKAPAELASAMAKVGGRPSFLLRLELRSVVEGITGFVAEMMKAGAPVGADGAQAGPSVPPGAPIPLLVFAGVDGRVYRGGLSVDVGAVVQLVKAMGKQMAPTRPVIEPGAGPRVK